MNSHKNAPLTPKGREAMVRSVVEGGLSQADAALSVQYDTQRQLPNGSSGSALKVWMGCATAPQDLIHCRAKQRPPHARSIEALRRQRHTGKQIAAETGVSPATVSRILRRWD